MEIIVIRDFFEDWVRDLISEKTLNEGNLRHTINAGPYVVR